jgi:hypothetical protein
MADEFTEEQIAAVCEEIERLATFSDLEHHAVCDKGEHSCEAVAAARIILQEREKFAKFRNERDAVLAKIRELESQIGQAWLAGMEARGLEDAERIAALESKLEEMINQTTKDFLDGRR